MEGWGVFCSKPLSLIQTVCKRRFEGHFLDIDIFNRIFFYSFQLLNEINCVIFLLGLVNGSIRASFLKSDKLWCSVPKGTSRKRYFSIVFSICRQINVILFKKLSVFLTIIPSVTPYIDIEWNSNTLKFVWMEIEFRELNLLRM